MLMNHKKINFTQIPDKTNDMIYLKSPKNLFWAISDHFSPMGKKSRSVTCKKLMSQSKESLQIDGRMERKMDGQTLFYRTVPAEAEENFNQLGKNINTLHHHQYITSIYYL